MLCPTNTQREISKALSRLQYIYESGDALTIDKYIDLFIYVVSRNKYRPIIEDERCVFDPSKQIMTFEG